VDGALALRRDECYGCGLCVDGCPLGCVEMIPRIGT
jgi:NAD-dependent dihydropyrimidine dehydrogenase PreA subunit